LGQDRTLIDPDIPSYVSTDSVSGTLNVSASGMMAPLVQGWVNNLLRQYPNLKVAVVVEDSKRSFSALLQRRTDVAALPRRITATEIAEFILEFGYEPTEVRVAGRALHTFVHEDNASTDLKERDAVFRQIPHNRMDPKGDAHTDLSFQSGMGRSYPFRQNLYLYFSTPPKAAPTRASAELVRYALSREGQELVLDLGHSPLSFLEIGRVGSRWSACCNTP
jgi:ABC-type phosphate transport system substrate-binding protein